MIKLTGASTKKPYLVNISEILFVDEVKNFSHENKNGDPIKKVTGTRVFLGDSSPHKFIIVKESMNHIMKILGL